ncbi:hypothetical protein GUITHDRAFT_118740 [Guillardia theta CCMP2712]|uniref:Glycosyltransferase 61 catalytic domain-containing protein n=1 Tax=Guillardia theta (strain CCMP2712) TaxID=905079 RepID=L1IGN3_GUITC|nr:hypothetical protein GUITHDRAFT_118740 [Guillardia theta CCMP2712]EKX35084.1 hypothetical protein GUITHDRAFT_118740 [Guillardia theta CCMP2712]|eukprot:XP_005822064.1 hypothetical protein GUITHDRAFT_118740 [Guillardia theta CCMP2712]
MSENRVLLVANRRQPLAEERIVIERDEDFSQRLKALGFSVTGPRTWVNVTRGDNEDWINHTIQLWKIPAFRLSHHVVRDLVAHHEPTFQELGRAQVNQQEGRGILSLSYYPMMPETLPGVATLSDVIVHTHGQYWGDNYYHFMIECLPRLALVTRLLEEQKELGWHVHVMRSRVSRLVLPLMGVKANKIVSGSIFASLALVPEPVPCARCPASMLNLLRKTLLASPQIAVHPRSDKCSVVLLKRKGVARQILNHDELMLTARRELPACDIREHNQNLPLSSQLAIFRDARAVLAPHGSEINIVYAVMAYKLQLRYIGHSVRQARQDGPMRVSVDVVVNLLKRNV